MKCWSCAAEIEIGERVEFRACCPKCDRAAHVCRNCEHYAPGWYNDCREPAAERVIDKERANFCEYFRPRHGPSQAVRPTNARDQLDALFKKKSG